MLLTGGAILDDQGAMMALGAGPPGTVTWDT